MASTYVNDLRLNEMATGDASGTWGTITNTNLELIGEALGYGTQDCFTSDADATTTVADGATDPARAMYFKVTSSATLTATRTLTIAPNTVSRLQFIENATLGGQSINISQGSGANVTIPSGATKAVYLDGVGSGAAVTDAFADLSVVTLDATTLQIGGTSITATATELNYNDISTLGQVQASKTVTADSNGFINFADNQKARFGAGADLQIYHDASHSFIQDVGTGDLRLASNGTGIFISKGTSENMAKFLTDGAVELYYDQGTYSAYKLATKSDGVDITGELQCDTLDVDGASDFTGNMTVNNSDITVTGTGNRAISVLSSNALGTMEIGGATGAFIDLKTPSSDDFDMRLQGDGGSGGSIAIAGGSFSVSGGATLLNAVHSGAVTLYHNGSDKLVTTSSGIQVTGNIANASGNFTLDVAGTITLDADDAGTILVQDGGTAYGLFKKSSNDMIIQAGVQDGDVLIQGNDGGSTITALTLDMSAAGDATFNNNLYIPNYIYHNGDTNTYIHFPADDNFQVVTAGYSRMKMVGSETVFNEDSADIDFRVEGNNNTHALFVQGGSDFVGIGNSSPNSFGSLAADLVVGTTSGDHGLTIATGTANSGRIQFADNTATPFQGAFEYDHANNAMMIYTGGTQRLYMGNDGATILTSLAGSNYVLRLRNDRNNNDGYGLHIQVGTDDGLGTHYQIDFADGDGTIQGSISSNNGTVTYGAFTAFHPCIIPDADNDPDSVANAYPYGTLLEITSLSYTQKNGADTERGILYNVQKSSSAKSKAVLGAYGSSMNSADRGDANLHQALVLGDGHILCNNENGNIAVGDYICTSSVSGEGMKATSICATIGVAREAISFANSTAVLVAVEYGYRQFVPEDLEARILALETA